MTITHRSTLLAFAVLAAACADLTVREHPVGRVTRQYVDSTRSAWDGRTGRPIATQVWYPARAGSVQTVWETEVFRFGSNAVGAPFADDAPRPLILLSHGTGGSAAQLSWLAESLARQGYIVAGVDHHGNTAAEAEYRLGGFILPGERARDLSAVIGFLMADSLIGARIDTSRIGATGFSLGGFTVLATVGAHLPFDVWQRSCAATPELPWCALPPEAPFTASEIATLRRRDAAFRAAESRSEQSVRDPRIKAAFAMAPALLPAVDTLSLRAIAVPVRVILGELDDQVPAEITAGILGAHLRGAQVERLPGVSHYAFLAECTARGHEFVPALCASGDVNRAELHRRVGDEVVAFFEERLRHR